MTAHDFIELQLHFENGQIERQRHALPVLIGRGEDCTLRLTGWRVGRHHARLLAQGEEIFVEDLGTLIGTTVNGLRVATYGPLHTDDAIVIGACRLRILTHGRNVDPASATAGSPAPQGVAAAAPENEPSGVHASVACKRVACASPGADVLGPTPLGTGDGLSAAFAVPRGEANRLGEPDALRGSLRRGDGASATVYDGPPPALPTDAHDGVSFDGTDVAAQTAAATAHPSSAATSGVAPAGGRAMSGSASASMPATTAAASATGAATAAAATAAAATAGAQDDALTGARQLRRRLHLALLERLDLRRRDVSGMSDAALRQQAAQLLRELISESRSEFDASIDAAALTQDVLDEALGLGPLEVLLADPAVTEIMVNRHDCIYIESEGRLTRHGVAFSGEAAVRGVLERIVAPLGRRVDESSPMVDARLPDGSRVNAVIPPVALGGAVITIRKFPQRHWRMADLLAAHVLSEAMADYLTYAVHHRRSIIVSGGTGAGKTTLLNVLSDAIPEGERIITIEDAAELRLVHAHRVALEARPSNAEGRGRIEIRDLVRNALRMRPDRIVVGECRGAEAFDMLTAMNTGHEGSLTTLHANSPRDALGRLESMVLMAGLDLPLAVVREYVASSIDLVVQQSRLSSGRRVVTQVVEVTGLESGCVQTQALFAFDPRQGFIETDALAMTPADWRGAHGCTPSAAGVSED